MNLKEFQSLDNGTVLAHYMYEFDKAPLIVFVLVKVSKSSALVVGDYDMSYFDWVGSKINFDGLTGQYRLMGVTVAPLCIANKFEVI